MTICHQGSIHARILIRPPFDMREFPNAQEVYYILVNDLASRGTEDMDARAYLEMAHPQEGLQL